LSRIITSVLLLICLAPAHATADELKEIIAEVQKAHSSLKDYSAHFTQTVESFGKTTEAAGMVYIKMPGKMRWDYEKPTKKHLISDGSKLWMHLVAEKQVYIQPLGDSAGANLPLRMLTGKMDFSKDYHASLLNSTENLHNLRLIPIKKGVGFQNVTIAIDRKSKRIVRFELLDLYGSRTVATLTDTKINTGLKDSMFTYRKQPGVEIITAPGPQ